MKCAVYSVDTVTGGDRKELTVSQFPWERLLSAGATMQPVRVLLDENPGITQADLAEWSRTLVLEYDGDVRAAGIIRGHDYVMETHTVDLTLIDLWGILARRGAWDHDAPHVEKWSVTYTSTTLGTLAKRAMQRGLTATATAPAITLPVTLPADVSGSLTRTYYGYNLEFVGDVLDDLLAEGLDIDFRPRWVSGALDYQMLNDPNTATHEWAVNVPESPISGLHETGDGSRVTNNADVVGEGSGRGMLARSWRYDASTYPLLERIEFRKNISDADQANAIAGQIISQYSRPTAAIEFQVVTSEDLQLGDTVRLIFVDPWFGPGIQVRRIVKLSGSPGSKKITVTCHPTGGA